MTRDIGPNAAARGNQQARARHEQRRPRALFTAAASACALSLSCGIDDRRATVAAPADPGAVPGSAMVGAANDGASNGTANGAAGGTSSALPAASSGAVGQSPGELPPLPEQSAPPEPGAPMAATDPSACAEGQTACTTGCFDLLSDARNCGRCGVICDGDQLCSDGVCACSGERTPCFTQARSLSAESIQVNNVAAYADATRDWVAYAERFRSPGAQVVIHDLQAMQELRRIDTVGSDVQLAFTPAEPTLLYSSNGELFSVTAAAAPQLVPLANVEWFALSDSGTRLAAWDGASSLTVHVYPSLDVVAQLVVGIPVGIDHERLAFSRDERWLAISSANAGNQLELFDLADGSGRVLSPSGSSGVYSPTFSEDGRELYVGGARPDGQNVDGVLYTFDTATGAELRSFSLLGSPVRSLARVPGYPLVLAGSLGGISVHDPVTEVQLQFLGGLVHRALFSADGRRMYAATGNGLGELVVYDVDDGTALAPD